VSFTGCVNVGDDPRNPQEGDLSLSISMVQTVFNTTPESINVEIVLENICHRDILIEKYLWFSATMVENILDPDGNKIELLYDLLDYEPEFSEIEPGENISEVIDLIWYGSRIDDLDFNWDKEGQYTISIFYNSQIKYGGHLSVESNTITFNLED
jgi:hypothetical protein